MTRRVAPTTPISRIAANVRKTTRKIWEPIQVGLSWKIVRVPQIERSEKPHDYITLATSIKNEADYLPEWIEFHQCVGVDPSR